MSALETPEVEQGRPQQEVMLDLDLEPNEGPVVEAKSSQSSSIFDSLRSLHVCSGKKKDSKVEQPRNPLRRGRTEAIRRAFSRRLSKSMRDLKNITGADEDVQVDAELASGETALTFYQVSFSIQPRGMPKKEILSPMSGHFEPGTLVALMGPSGCGKSTLLDILADKKRAHYDGVVHVNGRPRDKYYRRMTAYVPQQDVMPAHLTVQEALAFHNELRQVRPSKLCKCLLKRYYNQRLQVLGLYDIKDSYVGDEQVRGISGGQKRRLSLAKGLDSGAQLVFCDEPTTGLSATDAEACVRYMRLMAHKYCLTIIVVIHQPRIEVARLFDHLLLLTSQPGRVVYNGPMKDLPAYCSAVGYPVPLHGNPTDFVMDLVTPGLRRSRVEDFRDYYVNACKPAVLAQVELQLSHERRTPLEILESRRQQLMQYGYVPPVQHSAYGVSFCRQFNLNFRRQLLLRMRDRWFIIADFAMAIAKAILVGTCFVGIANRGAEYQAGFFFMVLMACSIDGLKAMPRLISERTVMKMETSEALYSEWAYILPFTLISSVQAFLNNLIFVSLLFAISGVEWSLFPAVFFWSTLLYYTMDGLYLMIAGAARTAVTAQVVSLPFLVGFLLFNGFTVTRATVPGWLSWALDLSPVAFAMEQVMITVSESRGGDASWDFIMKHFGYTSRPVAAVFVMCGCTIAFRVIQVVCLRKLNNINR